MDIERLFRPSKYFVLFCALLILVWAALQGVSTMRVTNAAKRFGNEMFTWSWPRLGWRSQAHITSVKIVKKGDADAVVDVCMIQTLTPVNGKQESVKVVRCMPRFLFYKSSNNWIIGKVELH